ncbi:YqgE/AlgH family protein [Asticcacaulis sp. AC460]|uniref:YqgE/AlgH family protein n=1 Tax=Asticcacaulis sp. AC460 TaxID=1282360 RepID=UPI001F2DC3B6|nr:YqgE/AlgH family protein [Asticcacaulis sp. AC460]
MTDDPLSLQGQLLIAMPGLAGEPFEHSVVYVCQHDENHAMGLILNQPINGLNFGKMVRELGIDSGDRAPSLQKIFRGGPVQNDRGFVLHSLDYQIDKITVELGGPFQEGQDGEETGMGLTASRDILVDLSSGTGPARSVIALGYAGWGPGQLENELGANAWLVAPASQELIFMSEPEQLWSAALATLGVEPAHLSGTAGRA